MSHRTHPSRKLCDTLGELLTTRDGFETARLLQDPDLFADRTTPPASQHPANQPGIPEPRAAQAILDWQPTEVDGGQVFVHADSRVLRPATDPPPHRICLLGESAAAGYFYLPDVTPAKLLESQLAATTTLGCYEVVDLTRPALTLDELLATAAACLAMKPHLLLLFAGNNWLWTTLGPRLDRYAEHRLADFRYRAAVIEEAGVAGLRDAVHQELEQRAAAALDRLATIAAEGSVRVVWMVPEVNLTGIEASQPVYWLPGNHCARWWRAHQRATAHLERGEAGRAATSARRMIALDDGACATSHSLLARALEQAGDADGASRARRAEVDAATWDSIFRRPSAVPSPVLETLRDACRQHGFGCVDLPTVFAHHTGSPLSDGRLFLDHSHLTIEGMWIATAAAAAAVLHLLPATDMPQPPDWQQIVAATPPPTVAPKVDALAKLYAGLYNLQMGNGSGTAEALFRAALSAEPGIGESMIDLLHSRLAPGRGFMSADRAHQPESPYGLVPGTWVAWELGADILSALSAALAASGQSVTRALDRWLIDHHQPRAAGVDLAAPFYRTYVGGQRPYKVPPESSLFRALHPESTSPRVRDGQRALRLAPTLRRGARRAAARRRGQVAVTVNDLRVGELAALDHWQQYELHIERSLLRPGLNHLRLAWPLPGKRGDTALQIAIRRLRQGLPADLYPVFGEIFSLVSYLDRDTPDPSAPSRHKST